MTEKTEIQVRKDNPLSDVIKKDAWMTLSKPTRDAYQSDYDLFFDIIRKAPKKVTASDIMEFIEYLEDNDYKNSSINRKISSLSKMFKVMVIAGEVTINPVDTLKQFKKISRNSSKEIKSSLSIEDIKRAVIISDSSTVQHRKMCLIVRMLAMSGLRITEFINIQNRDINDHDEENKIVRIIGKGRKERFIYIPVEFYDEVKEMYSDESMHYLFYTINGDRYNRKVLWKQVKAFFRKTIKKEVHPHMLRHTFITHKISVEKQDIKAVSRYAGHQDVSTTLNMYVDKSLNEDEAKIKI